VTVAVIADVDEGDVVGGCVAVGMEVSVAVEVGVLVAVGVGVRESPPRFWESARR